MNKDKIKMYVFEYNENNGNFHRNVGNVEENTNGYQSICETYEYIWRPFSNWLYKRYDFYSSRHPSFEVVKKEWEDYLQLRLEIKGYEKQFTNSL